MIIGLISDTHGSLNKEALQALRGSDHILHAGDIGGAAILEQLATLAPVTAVRGNTDGGSWAAALPPTEMRELGGKCFYLLHDPATLDLDPPAAGIDVVVSGHTHQASIAHTDGVLYFNPGSASQGRHGGTTSVGRITIDDTGLHPRIIAL